MENKVYLLETTIKNDGWVTEVHMNRVFSTMEAAQEQLVKCYVGTIKKKGCDDIVHDDYNNWDRAEIKYKEDVEYMTMFLTITPLIVDDAN